LLSLIRPDAVARCRIGIMRATSHNSAGQALIQFCFVGCAQGLSNPWVGRRQQRWNDQSVYRLEQTLVNEIET
jgi:hypothetical protein